MSKLNSVTIHFASPVQFHDGIAREEFYTEHPKVVADVYGMIQGTMPDALELIPGLFLMKYNFASIVFNEKYGTKYDKPIDWLSDEEIPVREWGDYSDAE